MTPEQYQRAKALFARAIELPEDRRAAWLDDQAGDDNAVRREVAEMLAEHGDPDAVGPRLESGAVGLMNVAATEPGDATPERIGDYRIVGVRGRGGMGVVYEAVQESPRRRVALKVIRSPLLSPQMLARFRREAEVLGQLQHPGIAHIYQAAITPSESGEQPYFAMEFIDGDPIHEYARNNDLSPRQRLELIERVCDAVHHAHQKGVIHRDLKPANILVVGDSSASGTADRERGSASIVADAIGQPKILDFGIARITDGSPEAVTQYTDAGQLIGTLAYMSPEQAGGRSSDIDTRSDIYAIGVVLFELLTGRPPLEVGGRPIAEAARIIRDEEPTRAGALDTSLRGDVETIISKAIEKDRERRYESAAALAQDIRRFLRYEPISARPVSTLNQIQKFARRNRGLVGGLAVAAVVLVLGAAGTMLGLISALRANASLTVTIDELEVTNAKLEKLGAFHSGQLAGIDVPLMGLRLREDLFSAFPQELRSEVETDLERINFVDVARLTLDRNLFGRVLQGIEAEFADQPALQAMLFQDLATTMRELGLLQAAVAPQRRALEIRRREFGDEIPDTAASLHESGILELERGDFDQAEAQLREAWTTNRQLLGDDAPRTLGVAGSLATVLQRLGRYGEAEELARQALVGLRAQVGSNDPETLQAMATLAQVLNFRGKYDESERLYREALQGRRATLGDDHRLTLSTMTSLAVVLENAGQYEEAIALAGDAFAARSRILGSDHPDTLSAQMELGARLMRQGKLTEAESTLRDVLDKRRRVLGRDHYDTLTSEDALASLLDERAHYVEAEALYRDVHQRRRRTLGEDHAATLQALGNLGFILSKQGEAAEAEPIYRETLAGLRRVYGDDHPHTLTSVGNLAALLSGLGKDAEAEPLYYESLEGRRRLLGEDHPSTLNAIYNMGDMLRRRGKLTEAEPYCRQALEGYRRVGGDDHIGTLYSLANLGLLLMDQGKPAEAAEYFQEAVDRRKRINGDDHPQTLDAIAGLAEALEAQDLWSDAEEWRRLLRDVSVRTDPANESEIAAHLAALGSNLIHQKKNAEAETILVECVSRCERLGKADNWRRWNAQSLLGEAIAADSERSAEAEGLLVEAAERIDPPANASERIHQRVADARRRLAKFYDTQGKPDEAARWRGKH